MEQVGGLQVGGYQVGGLQVGGLQVDGIELRIPAAERFDDISIESPRVLGPRNKSFWTDTDGGWREKSHDEGENDVLSMTSLSESNRSGACGRPGDGCVVYTPDRLA
jgi:hypothetical protein